MFVNLTNLAAGTRYHLTVDCIPVVDDKVLGFWSDQVSMLFTTKEDGLSRYSQCDYIRNLGA